MSFGSGHHELDCADESNFFRHAISDDQKRHQSNYHASEIQDPWGAILSNFKWFVNDRISPAIAGGP